MTTPADGEPTTLLRETGAWWTVWSEPRGSGGWRVRVWYTHGLPVGTWCDHVCRPLRVGP